MTPYTASRARDAGLHPAELIDVHTCPGCDERHTGDACEHGCHPECCRCCLTCGAPNATHTDPAGELACRDCATAMRRAS